MIWILEIILLSSLINLWPVSVDIGAAGFDFFPLATAQTLAYGQTEQLLL